MAFKLIDILGFPIVCIEMYLPSKCSVLHFNMYDGKNPKSL